MMIISPWYATPFLTKYGRENRKKVFAQTTPEPERGGKKEEGEKEFYNDYYSYA